MQMMTQWLWPVLAFLSGSIPFSVWLGQWFLAENIRRYGDGNPGATNVAKAGGLGWGAVAAILDVLKGAIPVGAAYLGAGLRGWPMVATALAPVVGHVFSPFLGGRGGKGLATTIGIWSGLTAGEAPLMLGIFFAVGELLLTVDGWAVLFGLGGLLAHLLLNHPDPLLLGVWLGNTLLLAWTYREDLARRPGLRRWWR
jgi:glycerol-3-phosphate acyltransferase PlsY